MGGIVGCFEVAPGEPFLLKTARNSRGANGRRATPAAQVDRLVAGGRCPRSIAATRMASRQAHEGESHRLQFGCPPPLRNASTCVETIHPECQCAVRAAQPIRGIEVQQMDWSYKSRWDL